MQRIFRKKCLLFKAGRVYHLKQFTTGSENSLKDVQKLQMMPNEMWKWLRQQPKKDFYAPSFDALIKQWNKCINVGGGYVEK
jgi:hypothetical protein